MVLIGRKEEQNVLWGCFESQRSEFVAVYGRRRVGETFLVKELFGHDFCFYATGIPGGESTMAAQLANSNDEIVAFGGASFDRATNWRSAFSNLNRLIEQSPKSGKKVVFLDEVPWMATANSGFKAALGHFWNRWASSRSDVLLIVCGSAASWMVANIIDDRGGLHGRLTRELFLKPFTLKECEEYFHAAGIVLSRYQMAEAYMVFGGIPYYLSIMDARFGLAQNVDLLYFADNAPLRHEYKNLFSSLFGKNSGHSEMVEALARAGAGITRDEIVAAPKRADGGSITRLLNDLVHCGFVREYRAFGKKQKGRLYQLIDPFVLFHVRFNEHRGLFLMKSSGRNFLARRATMPGQALLLNDCVFCT